MEAAEFERVYEDFRDFHAFFAPTFGRIQWREHSVHYLQALLVQSQERRNAENLAEMVPVSARALKRFLTEVRWDDEAVTGRLQAYLSPGLTHSLAVWVFDGSDFPKRGVKSAGVTRQYCGALGKVAKISSGNVSGPCGAPRTGSGRQTSVSTGGMDLGSCPLRGGGHTGSPAAVSGEDRPGPGYAAASPGTGAPQCRMGRWR